MTSRKGTKESLADNAEVLLRATMDSLDECIHVVDADLRFVLFNEAMRTWCGTLGLKIGKVEGKTVFELFPFLPPDIRDEYRQVLGTGSPVESQETVTIKGANIFTETRKIPIRTDGKIRHVITVIRDVSEQERAKRSLREKEEEYRELVESLNVGVYRSAPDSSGRLLTANPAVAAMFGYESVEECIRQPVLNTYVDLRDRESFLADVRREGALRNRELRLKKKDGTPIWVSCSVRAVKDEAGRTRWLDGVIEDTTARREAEQRLRESERLYRMLTEQSTDGIVLADVNGHIIEVNPRMGEMLGMSVGEMASMHAGDFLTEEGGTELALDKEKLKTGKTVTKVRQARRSDGTFLTVETNARLVPDGRVLAVVRDISERYRREREILAAVTEEQQRIGRDLHDSFGQRLTGIALMAKALELKLKKKSLGAASDVATIRELLDGTLKETRSIARGLSPVDMTKGGLAAALKELAAETREITGVSCHCEITMPFPIHDNAVAAQVYRIAQEAVANALRHGKARNIHISLRTEKMKGRLVVESDGKMPPRRSDCGKGMGMQIMGFRAEIIGGALSFKKGLEGRATLACSFANNPCVDQA